MQLLIYYYATQHERIKHYFENFLKKTCFLAFHADDVTKVEPTEVHIVSHTYYYMIQYFISDGLYLLYVFKITYFYGRHT